MSVNSNYPWKRFWIKKDDPLELSDGGFLRDPEEAPNLFRQSHVCSFRDLESVPCLVLLGEPGIGKSTALKEALSGESGSRRISLDLAGYSSDSRLCRDLFDSNSFRDWVASSEILEVFLDSLDECGIHNVAKLLVDEMGKYARDRLHLRIACRTSEWPKLLNDKLPNLWGEENYAVYELAPLRRTDVDIAAKVNAIDSKRFIAELERCGAVALAIKPITLEFLIQTFREHNAILRSKMELYEQGCRLLCEESSKSRDAAQDKGNLSVDQRLSLAERIAAVSVFSGKTRIYDGSVVTVMEKNDISQDDLLGRDLIDGSFRDITLGDIKEVFKHTGLFSLWGSDRLGWAHWSYAEFLAARFVETRGLTDQQIAGLVFHPDPGTREVVIPQIAETAAWIALMKPAIMDRIVAGDPEVLIRNTMASAEPAVKARIVSSLMNLLESEKTDDFEMYSSRDYAALNHPGLAEQLKPYIADKTKNVVVRRAAIDIAQACRVTSLMDILLTVALDRDDCSHIRFQATQYITVVGNEAEKKQLQPLLNCTELEDPDDEIKGSVLLGLWPEILSPADLFAALTYPRKCNFYGDYAAFMSRDIARDLRRDDLPIAIEWAGRQVKDYTFWSYFHGTRDRIIERAFEEIDDPHVLNSLADCMMHRLERHEFLFYGKSSEELRNLFVKCAEQRRKLACAMMPRLHATKVEPYWLLNNIVFRDDIPWAIEQLREAAGSGNADLWSELIVSGFDRENMEHVELVYETRKDIPELAARVGHLFDAMEMDSEAARKAREIEKHMLRPQVHEAEPSHPPFEEIVEAWMNKFESGDLSAWWCLVFDKRLGTPHGDDALPGWQFISKPLKNRCIEAAKNYLCRHDPQAEQWLGTKKLYERALAGHHALLLLRDEALTELHSLSGDVWSKWMPTVLTYPNFWNSHVAQCCRSIVTLGYSQCRESVHEVVRRVADREDGPSVALVLHRLEEVWDEAIAEILIGRLKENDTSPGVLRPVLKALLSHAVCKELVVEVGLSFIRGKDFAEGATRQKAVESAVAFLEAAPGRVWQALWPAIKVDFEFGAEVFKRACSPLAHHVNIVHGIGPENAGDLYVWLSRHFPPESDPPNVGVVWTEGDLGLFRRNVLSALVETGTKEAVERIKRLAAELPEQDWLKYYVIAAERNRLKKTRQPVSPEVLFELALSKEARLVESGEQLLDVIIESLERLQENLHGVTPAAADLWNTRQPVTPKGEDEVSDYVKRHVERDLTAGRGIVANREVKISSMSRTDILVDALSRDGATGNYHKISVTIEVKCCWWKGLKEDMKEQLKDKYLHDNQSPYGIYLVVWFDCKDWDEEDRKKRGMQEWKLGDPTEFFANQAKELGDERTVIRSFVLNAAYSRPKGK